jgi:hypothetical protein
MNRSLSTLTILAMILLAIAICIRQTLEVSETLTDATATTLIVVQSVFAASVLALAVLLIRSEYARRTLSLRRSRFEIAQPLRRLLSTVWS